MISPKTLGAALAGMVSIVFWTVAVATFWKNTFTMMELTTLTTVSTTVVALLTAYLMPDRAYVRGRALAEQRVGEGITAIERAETGIRDDVAAMKRREEDISEELAAIERDLAAMEEDLRAR